MVNEPIDIVDENDCPIGSIEYNIAHEKGIWHRAVHVWIYSPKGDVLLQLRHKDMKYFPNKWDISSAGHIDLGEEPITASLRELNEEIGVIANEEDLEFIKKIRFQKNFNDIVNNEFVYIYFLRLDKPLEFFKIQESEVSDIRFVSIKDFEEELENNPENFPKDTTYFKMVIEEIKKRI